MARHIFGSQNITDTTDAIQLFGAQQNPHVMGAIFRARVGNNEAVYLGSDSAAKSGGLELLPGDMHTASYEPITVRADTFWVYGLDSGDRLDWEVLRTD